ncbi:MAG TPA: hypothetical protein VMU24_02365 [Candidatus Acidoferrales bacterium]|nr:hypothetical protein [Candidatus Acidoferrales bacterium]
MTWAVTFMLWSAVSVTVHLKSAPDADAAITLAANKLEELNPGFAPDVERCICDGLVVVSGTKVHRS